MGPSSVAAPGAAPRRARGGKASFSAPRTSLPTDMDEAAGDPRRPDLPPSSSLTRSTVELFRGGRKAKCPITNYFQKSSHNTKSRTILLSIYGNISNCVSYEFPIRLFERRSFRIWASHRVAVEHAKAPWAPSDREPASLRHCRDALVKLVSGFGRQVKSTMQSFPSPIVHRRSKPMSSKLKVRCRGIMLLIHSLLELTRERPPPCPSTQLYISAEHSKVMSSTMTDVYLAYDPLDRGWRRAALDRGHAARRHSLRRSGRRAVGRVDVRHRSPPQTRRSAKTDVTHTTTRAPWASSASPRSPAQGPAYIIAKRRPSWSERRTRLRRLRGSASSRTCPGRLLLQAPGLHRPQDDELTWVKLPADAGGGRRGAVPLCDLLVGRAPPCRPSATAVSCCTKTSDSARRSLPRRARRRRRCS